MPTKIKSQKITTGLQNARCVQINTDIVLKKGSRNNTTTNPNYQRVQDHMMEFGRAGKAVKLLRLAFQTELSCIKDSRTGLRLQKLMMEVVKSDPYNNRGMRLASEGDLSILNDFEFNGHAQQGLPGAISTVYTIDRVTGALTLTVPAFAPKQCLLLPEGCTHYKFVFAAAEIDFVIGSADIFDIQSDLRLSNSGNSLAHTLTLNVTPNSTKSIFPVFGIRYFNVVNGFEYPKPAVGHNTLSILKVDIP